jgi:hypothetical protein
MEHYRGDNLRIFVHGGNAQQVPEIAAQAFSLAQAGKPLLHRERVRNTHSLSRPSGTAQRPAHAQNVHLFAEGEAVR